MKGVDISVFQEGINFDLLQQNGIEFIILRGGFTGYATGVNYNKDRCFENFYIECKLRKIPVGAYWYSCANTYEKGKNEALYFYDNCLKGKQFEYPIYIDVENKQHQLGNKRGVTDAIKGFCETLENLGYYVGIYGSDIATFKDMVYVDELNMYDKWVARYGSTPQFVTSYGIWQQINDFTIPGYNGVLDIDISYQNYPEIIKSKNLNGYNNSDNKVYDVETENIIYTVKSGDNLWNIANKYGVDYRFIAEYNNIINADLIYPGQTIMIPKDKIKKQEKDILYIVKQGDTLSSIASKYGTNWRKLAEYNSISNPNLIYPNQEIRIPHNG